jgi:hypothetical protein
MNRHSTAWVLLLFFVGMPRVFGASYSDNFSNGVSPSVWSYQMVESNTPFYTMTVDQDTVVFSKAAGGTNQVGVFQAANLYLQAQVVGDFDVQVDFTNAQIAVGTGAPGNQIQLNSIFGAQNFLVVRSDEVMPGDTAHVFISPPGLWEGQETVAATYGTMTIIRSGTLVTGYFDGSALYSGNFNTNAATIWFSLQNNGTSDATSVGFGNFSITADQLVATASTLNVNIVSNQTVLSWAGAVTPFQLESTINLSDTLSWKPVATTPTQSGFWSYVTNQFTDPVRYFRLNSN